MNLFSPSTTHSFPRNIESAISDNIKRSSSVPIDSPRIPTLLATPLNLNSSQTNNNHIISDPVNSNTSANSVPNIRNSINEVISNHKNSNETVNKITNKLQLFITQQEQQAQINQSQKYDNTSSNFYAITQYILQSYFKVNVNDLPSLKLVDLIVDQTYTDSLTLRKLNDSSSYQSYEYFNTISRDPDISRCPIFALSVYFIIRWSHPTQPINVANFNEIRLLDPALISLDSNPSTYTQNNLNNSINSTVKVTRSQNFEPSKRLIQIVFPWLAAFRQDMLTVDRTNYKLHSLFELFEFMAKIMIQDLKYLTQNSSLLPNIVSFIGKFIPDLFDQNEFKVEDLTHHSSNDIITSNMSMNSSLNNDMSIIGFNESNNDNSTKDHVSQLVEEHFTDLSKKLTTENIRLSQQITQLKSDLGSLNSMCNQILQVQRQQLSGSSGNNSGTSMSNTTSNNNNNSTVNGASNNTNEHGGIIILDRNSINSNLLSNLVQSFDNSQRNQSLGNQQLDVATSTLTPMGYPNISNSISLSQNPQPSIGQHQAATSLPSIIGSQQLEIPSTENKRKLPVPMSTLQPSASSPFGLSPSASGRGLGGPESPYGTTNTTNKRFRLEDRPTPSQTALDSLLYKSVPSPKFPDNMFGVSRSGSTQMDTSGFPTASQMPNAQQSDNILSNENQGNNLLTSKIASPSDRSNMTMLSPVTDIGNRPLISKREMMNSQNKNIISTDSTSIALKSQGTSGVGSSINNKEDTENVIRSPNVDGRNPVDSIKKPEMIQSNRLNELPTKLPTITNTFKKSAVLAIGTPNSTPRGTNMELTKQPIGAIRSLTSNTSKEKKEVENTKTSGPNDNIKYKLSRDNKTIWDLYAEWYIGINGKWSIKKLIEEYGWRRWKVSDDSHFFPTRRIIIDYIEIEVDRGIRLGRFKNPNQPREDIRKILVSDLEKFRINNGLTLNSLSLYFRYLTKKNQEICIFQDFKNWNVRIISEEEKTKSCKRSHLSAALNSANNENRAKLPNKNTIRNLPIDSIPKNASIDTSTNLGEKDSNIQSKQSTTIDKPNENVVDDTTKSSMNRKANESKNSPEPSSMAIDNSTPEDKVESSGISKQTAGSNDKANSSEKITNPNI